MSRHLPFTLFNLFGKSVGQVFNSIELTPRGLLEDGDKLNSTDTDGMVTRFFRSCMDTAELERLEYKPLFDMMKELGVSLPMLESLANHETPDLDLTAYAT